MFLKEHLGEPEQLALMFQAVESARNGVVITDPRRADNPIIYTNPAFTEITGFQPDEILGKNCRFLQGEDRDQPAIREIRSALREEHAVTAVLRNYRQDGRPFYNELTISPVRDLANNVVAFVGIQNDITARIEAEARISDFYSVVSHELRTPIAKIKSALSIVIDGEAGQVNESVKRFLEISIRAADSLWRLIENILDFKKLESGAFRLLKQRLDLSLLLENAVAEFQPVADSYSISTRCEVLDRQLIINADGQRLVQVIENLLSNAVKFSPTGSQVIIKVRKLDGFGRVEIIDRGAGIDTADLSKLFGKFQQLQAADSRVRGGTGLGLAICKAIIEAHGGRIGIASNPAGGSVFWFELALIS